MDSTKIPIPPAFADDLVGFHVDERCWLFAKSTYQPSYWMMLKREGFSGDLLSDSSELEGLSEKLERSMLDDIYRVHYGYAPDNFFDFTLRNEIEHLVLSGQIRVFLLNNDKFYRLTNPYDSLYASNETIASYNGDPVVERRYALADEFGRDIVARWTKKDAEDLKHWNNFVIWREAIEAYDVGAEAVDTAGDFVVGLWDIGCFVVEIAYEGAKTYIKLQAAYINTLHNAVTGDFDAIRKDLEELGIWLEESVDSAQKLIDKAKEGVRIFDELMSDDVTRELIFDYLDSLYQSVPYRDSRTLALRLVFEVGIEVLLAFATAGAGNVARRSAQAASATNKAVKTSRVAKRIGPFTERAIDLMVDLAKVLDRREIKIEHKPASDFDVPDYANPRHRKRKPVPPKRMDAYEVDCFTPGESVLKSPRFSGNSKKMEKEFYQQLKDQEQGINNLTVGEYLENRKRYTDLGREGVSDGKAQKEAGKQLRKELIAKFKAELVDSGKASGAEATKLAKERAKKSMESLAALHDPDMIAGGYDRINTNGSTGMGNTNINSSIGSQWKTRVQGMDVAAEEALSTHGPDAKMNVELSRCRM